MARSYRRTFIETSGDVKDIFCHKVFCGWDYGIATSDAAALKSSSIYNELQVSVQFVLTLLAHLPPPPSAHTHLCTIDVHIILWPYFVLTKTYRVVNVVNCLAFPSNSRHEGFEGLAVVRVKTAVVWYVKPYGLLHGYQFLHPEVGGCRFL